MTQLEHPPPVKMRQGRRRQPPPAGDFFKQAPQKYTSGSGKSTAGPDSLPVVPDELRRRQLLDLALDSGASADASECALHDLLLEFPETQNFETLAKFNGFPQ
jgi:hypothetical protein